MLVREIDDGLESEDSLEKLMDAKRRCGWRSASAPGGERMYQSSSSDSAAANATLCRAPGETVRRQLLAYILRARGSSEGGGGGTRVFWKKDESPEDRRWLLEMVSACVGVS